MSDDEVTCRARQRHAVLGNGMRGCIHFVLRYFFYTILFIVAVLGNRPGKPEFFMNSVWLLGYTCPCTCTHVPTHVYTHV